MKDKLMPFNMPFTVGKEMEYISDAVLRGRLAGNGKYTKLCHSWLEENVGVKKAFLTPSCTAALEMAAILCKIKPGDEVIMPSFTFVSTASAFALQGATPVFVDISMENFNIDISKIEEAISDKTKAIVVVHYAGISCDMDEVMAIANKYNLIVIEDAAQAFDSTYKGRKCGSIAHLGAYSFHETKNCICGEGGALLVNDERFVERAEVVWEKGTNRRKFLDGQVDKYTWIDIGSSYTMSELSAAYLWAQFEEHEKILKKRLSIVEYYTNELRHLEERGYYVLPRQHENCLGNGHIFYLLMPDKQKRDDFILKMKERNIKTVFHYIPLHSSPYGKKLVKDDNSLPNTDRVSDGLVRLPIFYSMTEDDIKEVIVATKESIKEVFA